MLDASLGVCLLRPVTWLLYWGCLLYTEVKLGIMENEIDTATVYSIILGLYSRIEDQGLRRVGRMVLTVTSEAQDPCLRKHVRRLGMGSRAFAHAL